MLTCVISAFVALLGADDPAPKASPRPASVHNEVEGPVTIIEIVVDGTRVRKGDTVCKLDPSVLRDRLMNQKIAALVAEANFNTAEKTRMIAELTAKEAQAVSDIEVKTYEGEIALARSDQERSRDRVEWSTKMAEKGFVPRATVRADELSVQKAGFDLEQAQDRLKLLNQFRRPRRDLEGEIAVHKARGEELMKQTHVAVERSKVQNLERQILQCAILASADGTLRYSNVQPKDGKPGRILIGLGASVRQRQRLFTIEPN